jgi:sugar lactone lactonase YvrE
MVNNSMVYNPANGLFYLSVPSAAGAPYGNSVISIDPLTGTLGTPIPVGSEPNRMALTADGRYLWVALDGGAAIRRVDLTTGAAGMQFPLASGGDTVAALAALPGAPDSVVVSSYYGGYTEPTGVNLAIYYSGVARSSAINFSTYAAFPWALIIDGTKNEVYGP